MISVFGNPILPADEYIPDPEAHVFEDRVYIYGSHDEFNGKMYCENDYVTWSAPVTDLTDWRYEGIIYRKDQHTSSLKKGKPYMYAPDVAKGPDGRYYLYYSMADSSVLSVAVSGSPTGPFDYYGDVKDKRGRIFGESPDDYFEFDPAVLVDGKRIYLYSGSGQKTNEKNGHPVVGLFVRELEADMITAKTDPQIIMPADDDRFSPNFFEAASVRRFDDEYILVYMSTDLTGLHYAASPYPDKGFVHQGLLHSTSPNLLNDGLSSDDAHLIENNHGSLEKINGSYYIFNHRHTNQNHFSRQVVADKVERRSDGSFCETEFTSNGLRQVPFDETGFYPAGMACNLVNYKVPDNGPYVTQDTVMGMPTSIVKNLADGALITLKYFQFNEDKAMKLIVRGNATGELIVSQSTKDGQPIQTIVPLDVYSEEWIELDCRLSGLNDPYGVTIELAGEGAIDCQSLTICASFQ
jgi:hypothetical protein